MPISDAERSRRRRHIDESRHDAALDGLHGTDETLADEEDYVAGLIDLDELGRRVRSRYGVAEAGCALGRTEGEVLALVGEQQRERFREWSLMRAHPICTGRAPCARPHGDVWYENDVESFVERVLRRRLADEA